MASAVFDTAVDSMIVIDAHGEVRELNPAAVHTFGYDRSELLGQNINVLMPEPYYSQRTGYRPNLRRGGSANLVGTRREVVGRRKDGSCFPLQLSVGALKLGGQRLFVGICHDISERRALDDRMVQLATYDALTGCLNRHQLRERLQRAVSACDATGQRLAVFFIDLDGFKQVNDRHDHQVGDRLLAEVARRLRGALRQNDQLARVGGDEFVVIAEVGARAEESVQLGERLIKCLAPRFRVDGLSLSVGASVGVSLYPGESHGLDHLLNDADLAMYQAKAAGGNCVRVFQQALRRRTEARLLMLERLREALKEERLQLHYQLQYALEAEPRPVGMEALLRWHDGERGAVSPTEFIGLAEEYGLIGAITHWVLERACRDNLALIRSGLLDVPVAVNICGSTFLREDFLSLIGDSLARTGLPGSRLELEITERVAVSNLDDAVQIINSLRASDVVVSMDDFGTGYSSLGSIKQLPFDRLKIDRSFIAGLPNDAVDQAIVRAAVQVAASLDITVVAEGIETVEQLECLRAAGCDHGQGYWLARPMPLEQLQALLRSGQAANS
nr:EAL domain-containing protein [Pseudomonas insulae]